MALEVYRALASDDQLIVEAPTGTGKTLAYLVAAALSRKRVAISTGTKNLQEQLFFKDIPFVRTKLFPGLKAALLKGRGNFVCHSRFLRFLRRPRLEGIGSSDRLQQIVDWYGRTIANGQGDRAELENLPDDDPFWPEICSTTETCLGKKCTERDECFILRMRSRAADSDLMIVNHHLLVSDLIVKESGFGEVIPRYEALIVDEAHGLEDAATSHFGFHMSHFRIARLLRDAAAELVETKVDAQELNEISKRVEDASRLLFNALQLTTSQRTRLRTIDPRVAQLRDLLCGHLRTLAARLSNVAQNSEELQAVARRALEVSTELETILADEPSTDYACWTEQRDGALFLHASPVEVGETLRQRLYERVQSVVCTSATLSSSGDFEYFKWRVGLDADPPPSELILDSPFDYASQTLLYIPQAMPEPNSPDFLEALPPVLQEILERTKGRAFVLFTSNRNMHEAYRKMEGRVSFPCLIQGSRPKSRLLMEFRERMGSVLFATASFWEGVDVQGEALSCVIVDRLPFAPPDDPIVSARIERTRKSGGDPFYSFQVPMAILALKQGLGRLIRTRGDRGILCILDVRILTKPYGKIFMKSLYGCPISRDLNEIAAFFADDHALEASLKDDTDSPK
jgi:ATP-dependent DNA helicase DinG